MSDFEIRLEKEAQEDGIDHVGISDDLREADDSGFDDAEDFEGEGYAGFEGEPNN